MPHAVTATDQFLEQISGQLAEQNILLGELVEVLRPEPDIAEPAPAADAKATSPVVVDGAPEEPARKPAKKTTAKRSGRREVRGT